MSPLTKFLAAAAVAATTAAAYSGDMTWFYPVSSSTFTNPTLRTVC